MNNRCRRGPDLCIIVAGRGLRGVCEELNLKNWWGLSGEGLNKFGGLLKF